MALLCLFIYYPVLTFYRDENRNNASTLGLILLVCIVSLFFRVLISRRTSPVLRGMPEPIDEATPKEAHNHTGFDGNEYELDIIVQCIGQK